ncbi:protein STAY-GREEN LIKE, chloroplastic-like [Camellia sinensis]|uniref:protein STAY-GREEN LIKE, chloroplastic-like n=1 Tax=Camellia sinensis TaxID=4442 RepID=UPI001035C4BA|nr:protein STAY-GREEN LIKE, chloroplastic-like [Camellia sinensis]
MAWQVLNAVMHGDSLLFTEHQELLDAFVRVYFHSSLKKYNCVECWGPLKDAAQSKLSFIKVDMEEIMVECLMNFRGANNLIPMEIALKIAEKIRARERFAGYIVIPMWPEGNPTGAAT